MLKIFRKKGQKGFSLIELLMVCAIIGILAAIAIQQFFVYRQKGYNTQAKADLKSFYTVCQAYFVYSPTTPACSEALVAATFVKSPNVIIGNIPANQKLVGTTSFHVAGTLTYTIGPSGNITP